MTSRTLRFSAIATLGILTAGMAEADVSKPVITGFGMQLPSGWVDSLHGNAFLKVEATIWDSGSGANYLEAVLVHAEADGTYDFNRKIVARWLLPDNLRSGDANYGVYDLLLRIPYASPPGNYRIYGLSLYDQAGNRSEYFASPQGGELALPAGAAGRVNVYHGSQTGTQPGVPGDSLPPDFEEIGFSPGTVDVSQENAFIDVYISASDDFSGLKRVDTWFLSPDGSAISVGGETNASKNFVVGEVRDGIFYVRVQVPRGAQDGYWKIGGILLTDNEDNVTFESVEGEVLAVTNGDSDGDGFVGEQDEFPFDPLEWADNDKDGIGDNADLDDDNDGFEDAWEQEMGLDPLVFDDLESDDDLDGLTLAQEYSGNTNPNNPDSDGDGFLDGTEIEARTDPASAQSNPAKVAKGRIEGGNYILEFYTKTGCTHRITGSNDLESWHPVAGTIPGDGRKQSHAVDLETHPYSFFRAEEE